MDRSEFYSDIAKGNIKYHSTVSKFGAGSVGTTLAPVTLSGDYQTPTAPVSIEVVSSSSDDTVAGTGARTVTIQGIAADWTEQTVTYDMDGTTAVPCGDWLRIYRFWIATSGTYATSAAGSHAGTITLRESGGGDTWGLLPITPFPAGQSQIGCYTIPKGKNGYLLSKTIFVDSNKSADVYFFKRENCDDITAPFTSTMRLVEREVGVQGGFDHTFASLKGPFVGPCDVGFMARVGSGSADVSVEFELLIVDSE